ncbi:MAG: amidohydrolase family protein [Acidobacteriota bacterium]|nr:amidohydrolase family protein [Acidobacteriota bacterium]MDE3263026.1 amidohydrolase family protein [Acidobacteriota bacterium]
MLGFEWRCWGIGPLLLVFLVVAAPAATQVPAFHDGHYHPTDYIQQETELSAFLELMGDRVGRAALMGIPLQQKWDWFESGDRAPDYYLRSDAALYYYPFVDAMVAEAVLALSPEQQDRFDPMITGFNPTDMYATDHIRRVLRLYPGVFSGIGEFSIHKEVVSPKTVGHVASLRNPALDRILEFAGEVGLLALVHNDVDVILPHEGARPTHFDPFIEVVRRHPGTTILWAHAGLGRFVEPTPGYVELLEELLRDEGLSHLYLDLSWDVVAEQIVAPPETLAAWISLVDRWPDRFILGSDSVVATGADAYLGALEAWRPLLDGLDPDSSEKVRLGNYELLFDSARERVRAWEAAQR